MLTEKHLIILEAVVNTIIPPDDAPGGWDGGVGNYLLRQFEGDLRSLLPTYQQGLLAIEAEAEGIYGKSFADLTPDLQELLLANIEQGQVQTAWSVDPIAFFVKLTHHCAEGFYSDPGNGGNRGTVAWKMIGFEVTG